MLRLGIMGVLEEYQTLQRRFSVSWKQLDPFSEESLSHVEGVILQPTMKPDWSFWEHPALVGKYILLDWPLGGYETEPDRFLDTCTRQGIRLMVRSRLRWLPKVCAVYHSLRNGDLGQPGLVRLHRWGKEAISNQVAALTEEIDLVCSLFDDSPTHLYGCAQAGEMKYHQLHLGFSRGGMAVIDTTSMLPSSCSDYFSLSVIGSRGAAYADDHHDMQLLYQQTGLQAVCTKATGSESLQLKAFLTAIQQGLDPVPSAGDAVRALKLAELAKQSWNLHQPMPERKIFSA